MGELVNYNLNNKLQINLISIAYPSSVKCKIIFSLINKFVPELINLYSVFFSMLMWVFKFKFDKFVDYGNSSWNFCFFFKSCHSNDLGTRMLKVDREKKENEQGRNERITWTALQRNRLVKNCFTSPQQSWLNWNVEFSLWISWKSTLITDSQVIIYTYFIYEVTSDKFC